MSHTFSITKISIVLFLMMLLNGCALFPSQQQIPSSVSYWPNCNDSPVLLTDLTRPAMARNYAHPNGQICWNIDND